MTAAMIPATPAAEPIVKADAPLPVEEAPAPEAEAEGEPDCDWEADADPEELAPDPEAEAEAEEEPELLRQCRFKKKLEKREKHTKRSNSCRKNQPEWLFDQSIGGFRCYR